MDISYRLQIASYTICEQRPAFLATANINILSRTGSKDFFQCMVSSILAGLMILTPSERFSFFHFLQLDPRVQNFQVSSKWRRSWMLINKWSWISEIPYIGLEMLASWCGVGFWPCCAVSIACAGEQLMNYSWTNMQVRDQLRMKLAHVVDTVFLFWKTPKSECKVHCSWPLGKRS